jgi:acetyl esterase
MRRLAPLLLLATAALWPSQTTAAPDPAPPVGKRYVYKESEGVPQEMEIYFPPNWDPTQRSYPAIILFHGGGWGNGSLDAFRYQCHYLASRGMVAATANYTLAKKQSESPAGQSRKRVCIVDAKSAIRWMKAQAAWLGIDPARLITGGGSAGGHISLLATHNPGLNDPRDPVGFDTSVAAYVLFNPALSPGDDQDSAVDMQQHLNADMPPSIVFFGTEDKWKVGWDVVRGELAASGVKNIDEQLAPGAEHAFFNQQPWKDLTLIAADKFLTAQGFLQGPPSLTVPAGNEVLVKRK